MVISGLAVPLGRTGLSSVWGNTVFDIRMMQHEMSHIYGALDDVHNCTHNQHCIMNHGFMNNASMHLTNIWCDYHASQLRPDRAF